MTGKFFKYALQSVAGMIGLSVYVLADTFFIAQGSGADGLAVLNLVLPVFGLMFAFGSMIGIGSATRYTIQKSAGKETDYYFMQAVMWELIISIPFVLTGTFFPKQFLHIMGADNSLAELGKPYMQIVLIAAPLFMTNYTFTAFARNDNATMIAMIGALVGSLFNVVFDYILMFPMKLGLTGAALATAISPIITMIICSTHFFSKRSQISFKLRLPMPKHIISCCSLGVSAFVGEISGAVTTTVFNMLILGIAGNTGVAAYGVVANTAYVAIAILNGLAQGTQPLISESYGNNNHNEVKHLLKLELVVCVIIEAVIILCAWGLTTPLIHAFNSENNELLATYAFSGLRLYSLGFIFAGINIMLINFFSATDKAKPAFIGSILRGLVAIAACAVILAKLFGLNGVWCSFLAAELLTFIVIIVMQRKTAH